MLIFFLYSKWFLFLVFFRFDNLWDSKWKIKKNKAWIKLIIILIRIKNQCLFSFYIGILLKISLVFSQNYFLCNYFRNFIKWKCILIIFNQFSVPNSLIYIYLSFVFLGIIIFEFKGNKKIFILDGRIKKQKILKGLLTDQVKMTLCSCFGKYIYLRAKI